MMTPGACCRYVNEELVPLFTWFNTHFYGFIGKIQHQKAQKAYGTFLANTAI